MEYTVQVYAREVTIERFSVVSPGAHPRFLMSMFWYLEATMCRHEWIHKIVRVNVLEDTGGGHWARKDAR